MVSLILRLVTLYLDASTLEPDHEHYSDPSAVPCLCGRHMGIDFGFDCSKRNPALLQRLIRLSSLVCQLCKGFSHIVACRFFLGFVGKLDILLQSAWAEGYRRGCHLSWCNLLSFPVVYQEGNGFQDRSVSGETHRFFPLALTSR